MTFLPIVARELRVAARKPGTYLTRVGAGLGALIVGGIAALVAVFNPPLRFGPVFFQSLAGVALAYCLAAGRFLTADCLSSEKREETMGLLFLTDLKGYDVVLGKMAATSLNGLYGLLAVLPVLALTLLSGGITNGEFWRVALVLLDTFLFSLAIGIFASALTREFKAAIALNFYLLLALVGLLPALACLRLFLAPASPIMERLFLPCPVYTLLLAFDTFYTKHPVQFWTSAEILLLMSLLLIWLACRIAPHSWQVKSSTPVKTTPQKEASSKAQARAFRAPLLDQNPYYWLAARPWWKARAVWALLAVALFWLMSLVFSIRSLDEVICLVVAMTLNATFKLWITLEAGQTLAADVKSGAFELLLATPLAPRDIVRGQMLALRRQFLKPLFVVVVVELFFMEKLMGNSRPAESSYWFFLGMAGILMLAADVVTLSLVAMASALTEKNLTRAMLKTVRRVLVLPWCLWALPAVVWQAWAFLFNGYSPSLSWEFSIGWWFAIGMAVDFLSSWMAWRRLTLDFRELALRQFAPPPPRLSLRRQCAKLGRAFTIIVWRHPRNRKWALGLATVLIAGISFEVWDKTRSHDPPPEIYLTGSSDGKTLVAVAPGNSDGVYLILPDGSLWRWGMIGGPHRAAMPEQVGTNCDWSRITANRDRSLGMRRDGTIWDLQGSGSNIQVDANGGWVEAVGGADGFRTVARKNDGTLWEWLHFGGMGFPRFPTLVGTNHDWMAVESSGNLVLALRSDGTLWDWGEYGSIGRVGRPAITYPTPVQLCSEANWTGFDRTFGYLALRNKTGELWLPPVGSTGLPGRSVSIATIGTLVARTSLAAPSSRLVNSIGGTMWSHYEVHPDGTLWVSSIVFATGGYPGTIGRLQPVDHRTDWVAVANTRKAAFGLTADGTLWTWGLNLGEEPKVHAGSQMFALSTMLKRVFSRTGLGISYPTPGPTYAIQEKPRALMRLVPESGK